MKIYKIKNFDAIIEPPIKVARGWGYIAREYVWANDHVADATGLQLIDHENDHDIRKEIQKHNLDHLSQEFREDLELPDISKILVDAIAKVDEIAKPYELQFDAGIYHQFFNVALHIQSHIDRGESPPPDYLAFFAKEAERRNKTTFQIQQYYIALFAVCSSACASIDNFKKQTKIDLIIRSNRSEQSDPERKRAYDTIIALAEANMSNALESLMLSKSRLSK